MAVKYAQGTTISMYVQLLTYRPTQIFTLLSALADVVAKRHGIYNHYDMKNSYICIIWGYPALEMVAAVTRMLHAQYNNRYTKHCNTHIINIKQPTF